MVLGNNVALLRRLRGWTQEELAERCGLSVRTIRNVELKSVDPRRSSVKLILRANAEHLPSAVAAAGKELLNTYHRAHLLITSRRPVTDRWGANREIRPLPVEPAPDGSLPPAAELVLRHAGMGLPSTADLA